MAEGCIFCAIAAGAAPARILAQTDRTLAFMDINPVVPGHCLVIPRAHHTDFLDADPTDLAAVAVETQRVARAAVDALGADGVNIVNATGASAFQTVFHLHLHVMPRFADDDMRFPFVSRGTTDAALDDHHVRITAELDG